MGLRRAKVKSVGLVTVDTAEATVPVGAEAVNGDHPAPPPPGTDDGIVLEGVEGLDLAPNGQKLGEILVEQGATDQAAVDAALAKQGETGDRLGAVLLAEGAVDETQLATGIAHQYGMPRVSLASVSFDPLAVALIPEETARDLGVLAHSRAQGIVHIVLADPARSGLAAQLKDLIDQPVSLAVGALVAIALALLATGFMLSRVFTDYVVQRYRGEMGAVIDQHHEPKPGAAAAVMTARGALPVAARADEDFVEVPAERTAG